MVAAGIWVAGVVPVVPVPVGGPTPPPVATTPGASPSWPDGASLPKCRGDEMTGAVAAQGAVSSHAYVRIALTNASTVDCRVSGYVDLAARGHPGLDPDAGTDAIVSIAVQHGGLYISDDPGSTSVALRPGQSAYFLVETGTAYEGGANMWTVTLLWILLPYADQPGPIPVDLRLLVSAPADRLIPIKITALSPNPTGV